MLAVCLAAVSSSAAGCGWKYRVAKRYPKIPASEVEFERSCPSGKNYERIGSMRRHGAMDEVDVAIEKAAKHGGQIVCVLKANEEVDVMLPHSTYTTVGDTTYVTTTETKSGFKRRESTLGVYRWVGEYERPKPLEACEQHVRSEDYCSVPDTRCRNDLQEICTCQPWAPGGYWRCRSY